MIGLIFNVALFMSFSFIDIPGWVFGFMFYGDFCWILYQHKMKKDNIL